MTKTKAKTYDFYVRLNFGTARNLRDEIEEQRTLRTPRSFAEMREASACEITEVPEIVQQKNDKLRQVAEIILAENPKSVSPDSHFMNVVHVRYLSEKSASIVREKLKALPQLVAVDPVMNKDEDINWHMLSTAKRLTSVDLPTPVKEPTTPKKDCCERGECGTGLCDCSRA